MQSNTQVNFQVVLTLQYALPHLRKTEGNIINDTSLVAQIGQPGAVTYVATKVTRHLGDVIHTFGEALINDITKIIVQFYEILKLYLFLLYRVELRPLQKPWQ